MEQRVSLVTLGVADLARARDFYQQLGWRGQEVEVGATLTRPAQATFYGGYAGCFADPDGHLWEIAHNPGFPLGPDGALTIPDLGASS